MKILLLTTHLNFGGITVYTVELARELSRRGHEVYCASGGGDLVQNVGRYGLPHIEIPIRTKSEISPKVLRSAVILRKVVRIKGIQIVHAQTRVAQVTGCLLARFTGIPCVSTCHGFFKTRLSRRLFPGWGDRVIAISDAVKDHLINDFGVAEKDIRMIHNGIDVNRFSGSVSEEEKLRRREEMGLPPEGAVVGVIARLSPIKGHEYLLRAARIVAGRVPDTRFLIVGEGTEKKKLLALSREFNLGDRIMFRPCISDTRAALEAMDVFAFPSLNEGLGIALLEAMACGLPVAASNVGGVGSVVSNGENGMLVPAKDSEALAEAILEILSNRELAGRLGGNARKTVERDFTLDKMVDKVEKVYGEVLSGKVEGKR